MSISENEALESLQSMFPHWDRETLQTVLYTNNGHMERTIENILIMDGNSDTSESYTTPATAPVPSVPYRQPNSNIRYPINLSNSSFEDIPKENSSILSNSNYRGIRFQLPDDFLRPPNYKKDNVMLADEQLALMLQNELFQKEAESLGYSFRETRRPSTGRTSTLSHSPTNTAGGGIPDMGIAKTLSTMGETAKRNLSQLAMRFTAKHGTETNSSNRRKENEMKPLVAANDDDDEDATEVISFEGSDSTQRGHHFLDEYSSNNKKQI
eukprot:CAMPEP_0196761096 /NCGR_PEP_ID=MMETSP1095-20130614/213_1 /TAXON_ID=96789 ORGANISM="Chromulina nebulosa, Strain UTEXLB2642" /NCGR_SAMPLE_ID=MMETSP1095 /ASSEMBLY_ACC=CAM_ASM_000446 /LENGTH=267 /DNA_ID=CAMNT_0042110193 /DNA_START=14 /DNA_END=817 /DNA_ORIENTATION=+